jgi:hypothetical protein
VSEHGEQLREAFETSERQTPDPAAVYARVLELSTKYKRRRRGLQVAGGSVAAAGLIAAAVQLPSVLSGGNGSAAGTGAGVVVAAAPKPSPTPSMSKADEQRGWDAYFAAGYGYDDAVKLAELWKSPDDPSLIKAEAGLKLLAGQKLPFAPLPQPTDTYDPGTAQSLKEGAIEDAFFTSGYDGTDAIKLAKIWKLDSQEAAKIMGGTKLLNGEKLPLKPHFEDGISTAERKKALAVDKFFAAGYDYDAAVKLAKIWKTATPYDAKILGGKKLLAGQHLPIKP